MTAQIPNSGIAGSYQVINGAPVFTANASVPCAYPANYKASGGNLNFFPYFMSSFDPVCNREKPIILKRSMFNGILSQLYAVIDNGNVTLDDDWFCSNPKALLQAINHLIDGELGGVGEV